MNFTNKVVLVTGGAGFIGSHVVDELLNHGPEKIVIVDNFFLGNMENLSEALKKSEKSVVYREDAGDYTAIENIIGSEGVDVVFNLAVKPLPYSFINPEGAYMTSVRIAFALCSLLRKGAYKTLIHFSSSEAYGSAIYFPIDESHPYNPNMPYSAGKAAADLLIMSYHKSFGLDLAIIRPFNTYGPRQNDRVYAAVVPTTITRILKGEKPYIEWDGKQSRDFTFIKDIAYAAIQFYLHENTRGKIINIGSGKETEIKSIVETIAELMGYRGEIEHRKQRPADITRQYADISLARRTIGFEPNTGLEDGLRQTIQWYRQAHAKKLSGQA